MNASLPREKALPSLSPAQARALKKKLRSLRWQPEAIMREIALIKKLRRLTTAD
jgi:hypothetical protein